MYRNSHHNILRILLFSFLIITSCSEHNNPVSGGGFLAEAGPILFISDKSGAYQMYSMNVDGSDVQQLTNDTTFPIIDAKWSPDGKKIAVVSLVGDDMIYPEFRYAIFIMDADGKNKYQLTNQWFYISDSVYGTLEYGGAIGVVWSPNSKQIAYSRLMVPESIANLDIFIIDISGSNEKRIIKTIGYTEQCSDWYQNKLLIDKIDWSARDSSGKGIPHVTIDIVDTSGQALSSFGKLGEAYGTPRWEINKNQIFFSLGAKLMMLNIEDQSVKEINIERYNSFGIVSINNSQILLNASYEMNFNKVLITAETGTIIQDMTPFSAENLFATSWRR